MVDRNENAGPIEGLRVIELGASPAVSYCGKLLADLGAEVIKFVPSGGDTASPIAEIHANTGKRLVRSDPTESRDLDALRELLASAHAVMDGAEGPWVAMRNLCAERSRELVWCTITPFGSSGPYSAFKAVHLNVFHAGGEGHLLPSGEGFLNFPHRAPLQVGGGMAYADAGANAAIAVLAAIRAQARSGRGQFIDVSAQESQLTLNRTRLSRFNRDGVEMRRSGPPYPGAGMFRCRDGWIQMLGANNDYWEKLSQSTDGKVFDDERFRSVDSRARNADALRAVLADWCAARDKREVVSILTPFGFAVGPFNDADELLASEQLAHRRFFQTVTDSSGRSHRLPGVPYHFSKTPVVLRAPQWIADGELSFQSSKSVTRARSGAGAQRKAARPLAGIRVLDFSWAAAGPYATMLLALLGAEVIKVESLKRPDPARRGFLADYGGIDESPNFNELNLNKKSFQVDLSNPRGIDLVRRLLPLCDIVIDNFRPGVMKRLGLDAESILAIHPRMIIGSSSGNGAAGPSSLAAGLASIFSAAGGLSEQTGYADGPPTEIGESTDYRSGNALAIAVLAALHHRDRTGEGQYIDLSSTEVVIANAPGPLLDRLAGTSNDLRGRMGNRHPCWAPHNVYACSGADEWISIAVCSEAEWAALCGLVGCARWVDEYPSAASRKQAEDTIDAAIEAWTRARSAEDAFLILQKAGIACAPSFTNRELAGDPHLESRHVFTDVIHPVIGTHRVMRAPWVFEDAAMCSIDRHGPLIGQDNQYVLQDLLQLSASERESLAEVLC